MDINWIFDILASTIFEIPTWLSLLSLPLIGYFCWHNVYDYNDLPDVVTAIGANEGTIFITEPIDVTNDLTIPANITLRFIQGGTLNVSAGKTVTINGHVEAPPVEIFEGAGTVVVNTYPYEESWWGNAQQLVLGGEFALTLKHDGDCRLSIRSYSDAPTDNATMKHYSARGTEAVPTISVNGDSIGEWTSYGHDGVNFIRCARIYMDIDGVPGVDDMPGRIDFEVTPGGSVTPVLQMRLKSDGTLELSGCDISFFGTPILSNNAGDMFIAPADDLIIDLHDKIGAGSLHVRDSDLAIIMIIQSDGNFGLKATSFGTNAKNVFGQGNGTAPTTSPANMFQMYSADQVGGNACPHIRTENGAILKLYQCAKANYNNWTDFGDVVDALVAMGIFDAA